MLTGHVVCELKLNLYFSANLQVVAKTNQLKIQSKKLTASTITASTSSTTNATSTTAATTIQPLVARAHISGSSLYDAPWPEVQLELLARWLFAWLASSWALKYYKIDQALGSEIQKLRQNFALALVAPLAIFYTPVSSTLCAFMVHHFFGSVIKSIKVKSCTFFLNFFFIFLCSER